MFMMGVLCTVYGAQVFHTSVSESEINNEYSIKPLKPGSS